MHAFSDTLHVGPGTPHVLEKAEDTEYLSINNVTNRTSL